MHVREMKKEGRKKQARSNQSNSIPKAVTFPKKNELPRVGFEPTTLHTLDRALYQLSYQGNSAGWVKILYLIVNMLTVMHMWESVLPCTCGNQCIYMYSVLPRRYRVVVN